MMRELFALCLLFSLSHPLDHSTLEMHAVNQDGNPVPGVDFFLSCKMTFNTVERFLCTSGSNGACKSACMDCSPGLPAIVRARYLNQSAEQEIFSWAGSDAESCKPSYPPSNLLDAFQLETAPAPEPPKKEDGPKGAAGSIPENVSIETGDYRLSTQKEGEDYEYVSYLGQKEKEEADGSCFPAFALACLFALALRRS